MEIMAAMLTMVPTVLVGVFMYFFNRKNDRRYGEQEKRAENRRKEGKLSLEMQMATAKLSYATATALKRGHANGEVEDGIKAYEAAKKKYYSFINEQYVDHIQE